MFGYMKSRNQLGHVTPNLVQISFCPRTVNVATTHVEQWSQSIN